ncbi:MAG: AI-2E family transporter [Lachnospiraceae bacterium]|nr:AI-2E family transporter [Lachnospiraceae bacterium]
MKLNPFSKNKKKKNATERGHREPIVVKFFKEKDPEKTLHVNIDEEAQEEDAQQKQALEEEKAEATGKKGHARFVPNDKYFTVSIYAFTALAGLILFTVLISNIVPVMAAVSRFIKVLTPFIIGGIIAFILTPIVNFVDEALFEKVCKIKKAKLRAGLSITLTFIVFFGLIILSIVKLAPEIGESIANLLDKSKTFGPKLGEKLNGLLESLKSTFPSIDIELVKDKINEALPSVFSKSSDLIMTFIPKLFSTSYSILHVVIDILLAMAISIYMVCDKRRIAHAATKLVYCVMKPKTAGGFIENAKESFQIFTGFIIGKAIDSLIIGILTFIILNIFQLKYALLVAVIVGITNMIPFFGPFIGAVPGILLYLCIEPIDAVIFAGIILALQQFDGWVLGPMILGDSTGIRPIWVIFGITVGGAYFGFAGMFLGVPVTAVIVYLVNKYVDKKLNEKHIEVQ